ncbi:MAG: DUF456 domain-containing protein [Cyclobacteriaceae bacterium]
MDLFLAILGGILMIIGLVGCIVPLLPGPPLSYVGLLVLQFRTDAPFSSNFLLVWAGITMVVTAVDYFVPVWGTRRWGGSSYGMWGCAIGLVAGFWFGPLGIILGPFVGAFAGEMLRHQNSDTAWRAAVGSFFGFLMGTIIKLIASGMMFYYFIVSL